MLGVKSAEERGPIGAWLVSERERLHLSAETVALKTGIPYGSYRALEAGRWKPAGERLAVLERLFGTSAPDTKAAAPPEWAKRLAEVMEERFTARLEKWQLKQEANQRAMADAAARLERLARSRGGRSGKEDQETDG